MLDGLLVGAYPRDRDDVAMLEWLGVERILNLTEDREYGPGEREEVRAALADAGIEERRLQLVDYGNLPAEQIERAVEQVLDWLEQGRRTYLHCRAGQQRSAAIAAAVVALRERVDIDEALARLRARKPSSEPLAHQREDLRRWWAARAAAIRPPAAGEG